MTNTIISIIVAASSNNVIGKDNQLPWHLPKDLAYFKKTTTGSAIIMGRKTYESIGKALPNRLNIVITRNTNYQLDDAEVTNSLQGAIQIAKQQLKNDSNEVFIIGGAEIFNQSLEFANKLYLNRIIGDFTGDTYLPDIDWANWTLLSSQENPADEKNAYPISFEIYTHNK